MVYASVMYSSGERNRVEYDSHVDKHMALMDSRIGGTGVGQREVDRAWR
jgi:hypothetical protein